MRIFQGFDHLPQFTNPIVTIGSYDGVHAGHRVLLDRIVEQAHREKSDSVVITFLPHPRTVLDANSKVYQLNSLREKSMLLEELGVDNLIVAPFTLEFSMVSSHDFVRDYLIGRVGVSTLIVGYNHHFGHNKEGNFDYLYRLQNEFRFKISEVSAQQVDHDKVSSTVVRRLICEGKMTQAAHYLTQPYFALWQMDNQGAILLNEPNKLLPQNGTFDVEVVTKLSTFSTQLTISSGVPLFKKIQPIEPFTDFIVKFL